MCVPESDAPGDGAIRLPLVFEVVVPDDEELLLPEPASVAPDSDVFEMECEVIDSELFDVAGATAETFNVTATAGLLASPSETEYSKLSLPE